jgi:hypothetical protein
MNTPAQTDFFGEPERKLPDGFRYAPAIVPKTMKLALLERFPELPFKAFDFHGYEGKRRVVSHGWKYDFASEAPEAD